MTRLVLIDGNNWGFAGTAKPLLLSGERQVQAINYVIGRVREAHEHYPDAKIIVLWDGRSWRHDLYKEYKGKREITPQQREMKQNWLDQKPYVIDGLDALGINQMTAGNMEADDLAYIAVKNAVSKRIPVTLLTADEDWQQLVQPGVNWIDVIRDKTCNFESFRRDTSSKSKGTVGFKDTVQFIEAKCILGDVGDNIIGIKGIGPKTLDKIYEVTDKAADFLSWARDKRSFYWNKVHDKKLPKVLAELDEVYALSIIENNMKLVDLGTTARPKPNNLNKKGMPLDKKAFELFCYQNGLNRITSDLDAFLLPFKRK